MAMTKTKPKAKRSTTRTAANRSPRKTSSKKRSTGGRGKK